MSLWFFKDSDRLTGEREAIAALDDRAEWFKGPTWTLAGGNLALQADIEVGEVDYPVVLKYPALFPAAPPTVSPRDKSECWSGHQYPGSGELCLEWGPDNWEPHVTGADLLESAHKLLSTERPGGGEPRREVPSRHETSLGQELRVGYGRVAITDECQQFLSGLPDETVGTVEFVIMSGDDSFTIHIQSVEPDGLDSWTAPKLPKTVLKAAGRSLNGRFASSALLEGPLVGKSLEVLRSALSECGCERALPPEGVEQGAVILLLHDKSSGARVLWVPGEDDGNVLRLQPFRAPRASSNRSGVGPISLDTKRVGIVGLGSAGSKIALTLARSGVRDFLLIDDDVFLPENIERHSLDYRNVGEHKVNGVKAQLEALAADINVTVARLKLSGQEASSSVSHRLEELSACSVVVDATANPRTFNELAETVRQGSTPMVWLEVFAGGIGGLVARSRPGRDPDPFTVRARLLAYLQDKAPALGASVVPYGGQGAEGEPLIATDAEVGIIAHHAARLAVDILEEREPSGFPDSLYLIGLERSWLFEAPFHTIAVDVGAPVAISKPTAHPLTEENIEFLTEVINRGSNAG